VDEIIVVALIKGEERFVFLFPEENRSEAIRAVGTMATNEDINFSWYDAAVLSQKINSACKSK